MILYQQPRSLSQALLCGKTDETSMSRGHNSMPNFEMFASKIILVLLIMEILKKVI